VSDVLPQDERDVCACAAFAEIEAVLDRRCPEMKAAFWAAVDRLYRLDAPPREWREALSGPGPDVQPSTRGQ